MTHTNFKRMEGLPQLSKTGNKFIRSKGRIFLLEDQPRKEKPPRLMGGEHVDINPTTQKQRTMKPCKKDR